MATSPYVVGQLSPAFGWTWKDDAGHVLDITGSTITVTWTSVPSGTQRLGDGAHTIVDGPAGRSRYQQSATDMATKGVYLYRYKLIRPSEPGLPYFSDKQELRIDSA